MIHRAFIEAPLAAVPHLVPVVLYINSTLVLLVGVIALIACGLAMFVLLSEMELNRVPMRDVRSRLPPFLQHDADIAALAIGIDAGKWFVIRVIVIVVLAVLGGLSGILLFVFVGILAGIFVPNFLLAGRAANLQLKQERGFLQQIRNLRDRMSVTNQSLDTALQEIGRNPGRDLRYILAPLARGGSVVENICECAQRSHSPLLENALAVLLWSRSRSLESLIDAIDDIILPIGEAQLSVAEESMATLSQQRAVTYAMSFLMGFMFIAVIRVPLFLNFYRTLEGSIVLAFVVVCFGGLVFLLGVIVKVEQWTRWDVRAVAKQQEKMGG